MSRLHQSLNASIELRSGLDQTPGPEQRHAPADLGHDLAQQCDAALLADAFGLLGAVQKLVRIAEIVEQLRGDRRQVPRLPSIVCPPSEETPPIDPCTCSAPPTRSKSVSKPRYG